MAASKPHRAGDQEHDYLGQVAERLRDLLGEQLVGAYVGGSYALGDYRPGRSDLDVAAVVEEGLSHAMRQLIVERLRHESLPCPARGLELVVYGLRTARSISATRDFELNLNTGPQMPLRIEIGPSRRESHWFPIDRSIFAIAGIAISGPPVEDVFAPISPRELLPVLVESIAWHRRSPGPAEDKLLNACRALRFAREGQWSSKTAAGHWAIEHGEVPRDLILEALAARAGDGDFNPSDIDATLESIEGRLRALEAPPSAQTVTRRLNSSRTSFGKPGTSSRSSTDE